MWPNVRRTTLFGSISSESASGSKRIGLLFSSAQIDYNLDPRWVADIPDISVGDEVFSDGCGLISKRLAVQLSKRKQIIYRGARYTPTVFQIRSVIIYCLYGLSALHFPPDIWDIRAS